MIRRTIFFVQNTPLFARSKTLREHIFSICFSRWLLLSWVSLWRHLCFFIILFLRFSFFLYDFFVAFARCVMCMIY